MLSNLFYADTPLQVINCVSIASSRVQDNSREINDLIIFGQFSNSRQMYNFAVASNVFTNIYLYENVSGITGWHQRRALFRTYRGKHVLAVFPEFMMEKPYTEMLFSCPTAVTYDIYSILKQINPTIKVALYEDGTGTYTGSVFQGLIYPGPTPIGIHNRPLVNLAKSILKLPCFKCHPYPISRLYVKSTKLLKSDFGLDITEFHISNIDLNNEYLSPKKLVESISNTKLLYLEPPENADYFAESLVIEKLLIDSGIEFSIRRHPRTLNQSEYSGLVTDCTGGFWESLCQNIDESKTVLVGFSSSSMLSPPIEFKKYPNIIFLDYIGGKRRDVSEFELNIQMLKTLYTNRLNRLYAPSNTRDLFTALINCGIPSGNCNNFNGDHIE